MCLKNWHASYHELLEQCHLTELAARRDYLSLSHLYKIIQGSCFFPNAPINRYSNHYLTRSHERSHFIQPHAHTNVLYYSYFPCTISLWNSLPQSIVSCSSVSSFKNNLVSCDLCYINLLFFCTIILFLFGCIFILVYTSLFMYSLHLCAQNLL